MKRSLQVSVVVTPESGLISASIPLAPLKSGLQAATSTLDQVQVEATVWEFWSTRVAELVGMWERREIIKKNGLYAFIPTIDFALWSTKRDSCRNWERGRILTLRWRSWPPPCWGGEGGRWLRSPGQVRQKMAPAGPYILLHNGKTSGQTLSGQHERGHI